jgi:hypothetical protein
MTLIRHFTETVVQSGIHGMLTAEPDHNEDQRTSNISRLLNNCELLMS